MMKQPRYSGMFGWSSITNAVKKAAKAVKNFVVKHPVVTAIVVAVVVVVVVVITKNPAIAVTAGRAVATAVSAATAASVAKVGSTAAKATRPCHFCGAGGERAATRCIVQLDRQRTVRRLAYWSTEKGRTKDERAHALSLIANLNPQPPERSPIASPAPARRNRPSTPARKRV